MAQELGDFDPLKCTFDIVRTIAVTGFGSIAYGLHVAVASMTLYWVLKEARPQSRSTKIHAVFVVTLILVGSVNYFFSIANYLYETKTTKPLSFDIVPYVAAVFIAFICNCLLLYRCYVVWDGNKLVLVIPTALLVAAIVYGCLRLASAKAFEKFVHILVYWGLTLLLNLVFTCLISSRIFWMRRKLRRLLGEKFSQSYGSNLSIIVESSLLYTIVSLLGIVPILVSHDSKGQDYAFGPLLVQSECVASELIILRLVMCRAVPRQWETTARSENPDLERSVADSATAR